MLNLKFVWVTPATQYASGEILKLGLVRIGNYYWDSMTYDAKKYKITTELPGLKLREQYYNTPDEARKALEHYTKQWFTHVLKEPEDAT